MNRLDRLFNAAEQEDAEDNPSRRGQETKQRNGEHRQLAIEAPPDDYRPSTALIRLPIVSLGELDQKLSQIKESPRDMLRVSAGVIDPLLDRWTRWQEIREEWADRSRSPYAASVQNFYEPGGISSTQPIDIEDRDGNPRGYYLEGTTTNWREPHSSAARQQAAQRRKQYAGFQPSVSDGSSSEEDERRQPDHQPKKQAPSRNVLDSGSDTSQSEPDSPRQRRMSSNTQTSTGPTLRYPTSSPRSPQPYSHSYDGRASFVGRTASPSPRNPPPRFRSSFSVPHPGQSVPQPAVQPVPPNNYYQPPYTSPLPPLHTSNVANPYASSQPYSTPINASLQPPPHSHPYPGRQNGMSFYPPRYAPRQGYRGPIQGQVPPSPRDFKPPRSPSRLSGRSSRSQRSTDDTRKEERARRQKNMKKSATKGILGASAIGVFLEALEGLEL